jgi:DNA-3-methyladenine glycosylase I
MSAGPETSLRPGADGQARCWWATASPEYVGYHDGEWGRPVLDDRGLYERLCLEAFQSGLSWLTILRKREAFRAGFSGFEIGRVAAFGEPDLKRLLADEGIVRNRAKIEAAIENARRAAPPRGWRVAVGADLVLSPQAAGHAALALGPPGDDPRVGCPGPRAQAARV